MIFHTYGATNVRLSAIGFGTMRFQDQNDINACVSLVKAAYEKGINYFDTAPGYGKSESLLGVAFKEMLKSRSDKPFYVATKSSKKSPDEIKRDLETSLQRMGLDYIDFYHVWCVLSLDDFIDRKKKGILKVFEDLKQQGLIKHVCISTHVTGREVGVILNDYPFDGVLLGYSAMNFGYREAGLEEAAKLNRGVVVMNPLGGGLIPQNPDRFGFIKNSPNESVAEGAIRFLLNDHRITVSLVGFSSESEINDIVRAVDGDQPDPHRGTRVRDNLEQTFNELCTGCRYCDNCPEDIPVSKMMDAYNHLLLSGKPKKLLDRLYWHWGISAEADSYHRCTECRACEEACTQKLPICDRLKGIRDEVKKYLAEKKGVS